jgi:hypothetical protein
MSEQKPLNLVLDEIEERHNEARREGLDFETFAINVAKTARDVPWLVKALRIAKTSLEIIRDAKRPDVQIYAAAKLGILTAILNGEETDTSLGEHGAE